MFKLSFMSRLYFAVFAMLSFFFIFAEKAIIYFGMHFVRRRGHNQRRLLIVGTGRRAASFVHKINSHPEWGLKILGAIDDEPGRGIEQVDGAKILGNLKDISEILHNIAIDEVIFIVPRLRLNHIENSIHDCEIEGVKVTIAVDLFDLKIAKSYQTELDGMPFLTFKTTVPGEWQLLIKRMIDLAVSGIFILMFSIN
jgi:FlaA1/EpsC-like NDP-sugar epimerase